MGNGTQRMVMRSLSFSGVTTSKEVTMMSTVIMSKRMTERNTTMMTREYRMKKK